MKPSLPERFWKARRQYMLLTGEAMTYEETIKIVQDLLNSHENDGLAHRVREIFKRLEILEGKSGIWTLKSADNFIGTNGPLTNAPIGGQPWTAIGGQQIYQISNTARTPDGTLRGSYIASGVADGQVEADLLPGNREASLYVRFQSNGNYLLMQRKPEGFIGLYRFQSGVSNLISPASLFRSVVPGERFKVRFVGSRIWVFRVIGNVEELLIDVNEPAFQVMGNHGLRLDGTGGAQNFKILQREIL